MIGRPKGTVRALIELWDTSIPLSFFAFRNEVARISTANFAKLADTQIIDFTDFRTRRFDERAIYAFTDDDDWYAPSLPAELESAEISSVGVIWRSIVYNGEVEIRRGPVGCATNNYAILGSALARMPKLRGIAEQHFKLHDAVTAGAFALDYLDKSLSITNKHPASTVMLERAMRQDGRDGAREAVAQAKARLRVPTDLEEPGLGWAADEIEAMRRLIFSL